MEAEIIRWTLNLYKGDKYSCGIVTSEEAREFFIQGGPSRWKDNFRPSPGGIWEELKDQ